MNRESIHCSLSFHVEIHPTKASRAMRCAGTGAREMRESRDRTLAADAALPFQRHTCLNQYNSLANYRRHCKC